MVVLTVAAFIIGIVVIMRTIICPGDGPAHAINAYQWAQHPRIETHGWWLPGFDYTVGIAFFASHRLVLTPRLCNLVLDTLTIPMFYALVRKLYGSQTALLSSVAFVAFPLRIGLGSSSLTEAIFLFYVVGGLLFLVISVENGRVVNLLIALGFLVLAEMTRYEIWPLIPLLLCYIYSRTGNIVASALSGVLLALFPLEWSASNYLNYGNFFYALSQA